MAQKAVNRFDIAKRIVSKAALAKARMKLKYEAFIELNSQLIGYFYKNFKPLKWHGFNLLAIDGTTVQLPRIAAIANYFGVWHPRQGDACPKARVSQMFDTLNKITVDAIISPKNEGERELAAYHFLKLLSDDLVLLDRGNMEQANYPSPTVDRSRMMVGRVSAAALVQLAWLSLMGRVPNGRMAMGSG